MGRLRKALGICNHHRGLIDDNREERPHSRQRWMLEKQFEALCSFCKGTLKT